MVLLAARSRADTPDVSPKVRKRTSGTGRDSSSRTAFS